MKVSRMHKVEQGTRLSVRGHNHRPESRQTTETAPDLMPVLERLTAAVEGIRTEQKRIADHFDPPPPDIVGTNYVAGELGCTKVWVSQMARDGEIPSDCIVPGTGHGKPWKFRRSGIEKWLAER